MPRTVWPLRRGRPCVEIVLTLAPGGQPFPRTLLADTGAGSQGSGIDLILDETNCLLCGGLKGVSVKLGCDYVGSFPLYNLQVLLPAIGFARNLQVVGVPSLSPAYEGIACFSFLNRFQYGNFGNPGVFGLETSPKYCTISSGLRRRYFGKGDSPQLTAEMPT
jgi:hypothetical protein